MNTLPVLLTPFLGPGALLLDARRTRRVARGRPEKAIKNTGSPSGREKWGRAAGRGARERMRA